MILSLLFPPLCLACKAPLQVGEPQGLCVDCFKTLPFWEKGTMGQPNEVPLPRNIASFEAPFLYDGPIKQLVQRMKYHDQGHLSDFLTPFMLPNLHAWLATQPNLNDIILLPVPVHRLRLLQRMYNQSALLAQSLSAHTGLPCPVSAIRRVKYRKAQAQRSQKARRSLKAADFWADATVVSGKTVVLIDDIFTTGATAKACAATLKQAGATAVHVRCVAYVSLL